MEHLDIGKKGELKGLTRVDTDKASGIDVWAKVDMVIEAYTKIHPNEIRDTVLQNKEITDTRKNDMASGETGIRWGINIPAGLMFKLEKVEPLLFSNKKLFNKFMSRYKGFRTCNKV